jgi:hypothetical protein
MEPMVVGAVLERNPWCAIPGSRVSPEDQVM